MFNVGDKVIKNLKTWRNLDEEPWGRGQGVGVVVEPVFPLIEGSLDVKWPLCRCFERAIELLAAPEEG